MRAEKKGGREAGGRLEDRLHKQVSQVPRQTAVFIQRSEEESEPGNRGGRGEYGGKHTLDDAAYLYRCL